MLEIIIQDKNKAVSEYQVNYEDVKQALAVELKKYENLIVTEDFMQMAKKSRAELNAMKKGLKDRLSDIRKAQLAPYEALKENYTDKLEQMIDTQLVKIDSAIKEIEKKREQEKSEKIKKYFDDKNSEAGLSIALNQVFNPKWTNASYSWSKIVAEIDLFFVKVVDDLKIIESFDDEFIIPLRKLYLACFDMSVVMKNKVEFDREKQKRLEAEAEAERLRKELEAQEKEKENAIKEELCDTDNSAGFECEIVEIPDSAEADREKSENERSQNGNVDFNDTNATENTLASVEGDLTGVNSIPEENIPEAIETPQEMATASPDLEYIEFWVKVTPEQKLMLRNLVLDNHIKCGKIRR